MVAYQGRVMNNRRKLLIALSAGALAPPLAAFAQQHGKVRRIGFMASSRRLLIEFIVTTPAIR